MLEMTWSSIHQRILIVVYLLHLVVIVVVVVVVFFVVWFECDELLNLLANLVFKNRVDSCKRVFWENIGEERCPSRISSNSVYSFLASRFFPLAYTRDSIVPEVDKKFTKIDRWTWVLFGHVRRRKQIEGEKYTAADLKKTNKQKTNKRNGDPGGGGLQLHFYKDSSNKYQ